MGLRFLLDFFSSLDCLDVPFALISSEGTTVGDGAPLSRSVEAASFDTGWGRLNQEMLRNSHTHTHTHTAKISSWDDA